MNVLTAIPIFYQLRSAYQPSLSKAIYRPFSSTVSIPTQVEITPTPTPTPAQSIAPPIVEASLPQKPMAQNIGGISKTVSIALLGDSMIETLSTDILNKSLLAYYPNSTFNIANFGSPSQTIEYGKKRLESEIIPQEPIIIVIESFAYNNFGNTEENINRHWLNLGAITTLIKTKLPNTKIILTTTICPNATTFGNGSEFKFSSMEKQEKVKTIDLYLKNTINFATSQNFLLADTYSISCDKSGQGLPELINTQDNIHPSELGKQLFADTLSQTIYKNKIIDNLL
jgi:lysophospholipase L1-like esterase